MAAGLAAAPAIAEPIEADPLPPGAPTNVVATPTTATTATVSWTAPAGANPAVNGYDFQLKPSGEDWQNALGTGPNDCRPASVNASAATSCILYSLTEGRSYEARVIARNGELGPPSAATSFVQTIAGVPTAPTSLAAYPSQASAVVVWAAPASAGSSAVQQYKVQYAPASGSFADAAMCPADTSTSCTITGLTNGTAYKFQVAAKNSVGWGAYTSSVNATPSATSLPAILAPKCPSGSCAGTNLAGMNLSGLDLHGIDFSGSQLAGANFSGANLTGANLSNSQLATSNLSGATLAGANLSHSNLAVVNANGANFSGANMSNSQFAAAKLVGANMTAANAANSNFAAAARTLAARSLTARALQPADLSKANLKKANFAKANLVGAKLKSVKAKKAKFTSAKAQKANFSKSDLIGATFSKAKIKGINLTKAKYNSKTFQGAKR